MTEVDFQMWLQEATATAIADGGPGFEEWMDYCRDGRNEAPLTAESFEALTKDEACFEQVETAFRRGLTQKRQRQEDEEKATKAEAKAAKPPKARRARVRAHQDSRPVKRQIWAYAPVPRAIIRDTRLTITERMVAVGIADAINPGVWNADLHVDISQPALGTRLGISRWTVERAIRRLEELGLLEVTALKGRGGMRLRFKPDGFISISSSSADAAATTRGDDSDDPERVAVA